MGAEGMFLLLHGLVSALPVLAIWGEALRLSLRENGAGIRIPSRQQNEVRKQKAACISAVFCWHRQDTQPSCKG